MNESDPAAGPPAGWLIDARTGETRWWNGIRWTEHILPTALPTAAEPPAPEPPQPAPATRASLRAAAAAAAQEAAAAEQPAAPTPAANPTTAAPTPEPEPAIAASPLEPDAEATPPPKTAERLPPASPVASAPLTRRTAQPARSTLDFAPEPLTSKNGPAKAALVLILLLVLGVGGLFVLISGGDLAVATIVGLVNIAMVIAAFVLSIIGLVIAVRRPTKKRESIFGLVASILLMAGAAWQISLAYTAATAIDVTGIENQISAWAGEQTAESHLTDCTVPPGTRAAEGVEFSCVTSGDAGSVWNVTVTLHADGTATWAIDQ